MNPPNRQAQQQRKIKSQAGFLAALDPEGKDLWGADYLNLRRDATDANTKGINICN